MAYEIYGEFASGGMATIQYARLLGPHGFARPVAIKRLHPHFAKEPDFVAMFVDEARLSARLIHANIIPTLDVIDAPGELGLVMEYVRGESLSNLLRRVRERNAALPVRVAVSIVSAVLHGLHAAHEAVGENGASLGIVHRDVSPHNILVGADGIARIHDFGIAKAVGRLRLTPSGEVKGKLAYMAPEQWLRNAVDLRADVYGASVVLWEALSGRALFDGDSEASVLRQVLEAPVPDPSALRSEVSAELGAIVMRGLAREPEARFPSARALALELERSVGHASQSEIAEWLRATAGDLLDARAELLAQMQARARDTAVPASAGTRRLGDTPSAPAATVTAAAARPEEVRQPAARSNRAVMLALAALLLTAGVATWAYWPNDEPRTDTTESLTTPAVLYEPSPPSQDILPEPHSPTGATPSERAPLAADSGTHTRELEQPRDQATPRRPLRNKRLALPDGQSGNPITEPAESNCKPYYYIDKEGIKRPKPWCL